MEVQIQNVQVSIGAKEIVRGVSMVAAGRQMVGIIGPNGSGKSTLLKAVYRVLRPSGGAILLDGQSVDQMPLRASAQKMAVMAQVNEFSFDFTVEKMVYMGRTPYKRLMEPDNETDAEAVEEAIRITGIDHLRHRFFSTLSGGEKQRVLIARALAQRTQVLILDEPTNHLDIKYQLQLMDIVKGLHCTVLAAIHDLNIAAMYCDYLYALQGGLVVGEGAPGDLLTPALIRAVYDVDAEVLPQPDGGPPRIFFHAGQQSSDERSPDGRT